MYQYSLKYVNTFTKFYFTGFTQSLYKFTTSQFKFHKEICAIATQSCKEPNPSEVVSNEYDKSCEKKLNTLLQDPHYKALYDKYQLEVMYLKYSKQMVPENIKARSWFRLLQTASKGERRAYITFLWKIELREKKRRLKKLENQNSENGNTDNRYGLGKYSLFYRIRNCTISQFYNSRLISAMLFNPIIVIDISYDDYMTPFEQENCAKQLLLAFALNRQHIYPFNLYFCNIMKESHMIQKLHRSLPNIFDPDFPLNITSKSYLDLFDKEKLVYLSPNAQENMKSFDNNMIYIIGGMVDKHDVQPYSFKKANKEGIKMMKLPLSNNLDWGTGSSKNLPLNLVLAILLDVNYSNNWNVAFQNVPKRKLKLSQENASMKKAIRSQELYASHQTQFNED